MVTKPDTKTTQKYFNMKEEIKRKAELGVPLSNPTPKKQALYNRYQQAKANELALKAMTGQSLPNNSSDWQKSVWGSFANQNKSTPNADQTLQSMQQQQQMVQNEAQKQLQALSRYLQQSAQMQFTSQAAMLAQQRDAQIAQLEKAYADAVREGEMSIREAQGAFEEQKANIEKQAYLQSQQTQLMAQDLGIQNSQQLLGHVSADNQVINSMINQNMTTRDKRIADIKDRINNLKNKKNLDVIMAQKEFGTNLIRAYGDISGKMYDQQFQMQYDNLNRSREEDFAINQLGFQHKMDLEKMDKQNLLELGRLAYQHGLDLRKMNKEQMMQLATMAKEQGYKIDLMRLEDQLARGQMALQRKYTLEHLAKQRKLSQQELENRVRLMQEKIKVRQQAELREYELAAQRELAKYTPGTKEYKIREAKFQEERRRLLAEMAAETQFDAVSKQILNGVTEKPKKPKKEWWQSQKSYEKELKEYNEKMKAYKRYLKYLEDPLSVFPDYAGGGLGSLSTKYESKGNPGTISNNKGDIGGKSYGSYQLTVNSGNAQKFADWYGGALKGKKAGTVAFDEAWKVEAAKNPAKFAQAQHEYIIQTHYYPAVESIKKATGVDITKYPKAVQDVLFSIAATRSWWCEEHV